jgi:hypothetical protein
MARLGEWRKDISPVNAKNWKECRIGANAVLTRVCFRKLREAKPGNAKHCEKPEFFG